MNQHLKQRLIGATVLVVLGVIILPMLLDKPVSVEVEPDVTNIELTDYQEKQADQQKQPDRTIPEEVIARYELPENKQLQDPPAATKKEEKISATEIKPEIKPEKPPEKTEGGSQWAVQMGSFSSKENADSLVQRLKAQKFLAYFEDVETNGKVVYRVRVGPFDSKSKTEKMKQKLDQKEKLKTLIVTLH